MFYYSPLETETVRRKRAQQFGLTPPTDPFLHNQSLPYPIKYTEDGNSTLDMGEPRKCNIDKFKGIDCSLCYKILMVSNNISIMFNL